MRRPPWTLPLILGVIVLTLGVALGIVLLLDGDSASPTPPTPPPPTATPATASPATPTASPTPSPAADPSPPPTAPPDAAAGGSPSRCETAPARAATVIAAIEEAMTGYQGNWGLALIDLDCDSSLIVRPNHSQYPASAGKIAIVTAGLKAVQDGLVEFEAIEEHLELVLHHSLDANTDEIAALVTPEQVADVLARAGISGRSRLEGGEWRYAHFTPHDLALVWASIVRGEQLNERWTGHLLQLASEVILPPSFVTFPADFGAPGYQYGQKAGYWVDESEPYVFAAAGYARPEDGASAGFTFAYLLHTWEPDPDHPQRRTPFPLIRDYIVGELTPSP